MLDSPRDLQRFAGQRLMVILEFPPRDPAAPLDHSAPRPHRPDYGQQTFAFNHLNHPVFRTSSRPYPACLRLPCDPPFRH